MRTDMSAGRHGAFVLMVDAGKAWRHDSCALTRAHREWIHGGNEVRQLAERSMPVVLHDLFY